MDSLTVLCADLLQLRDEIADTTFRPAADDICARLTQIASRLDVIAVELALPAAPQTELPVQGTQEPPPDASI